MNKKRNVIILLIIVFVLIIIIGTILIKKESDLSEKENNEIIDKVYQDPITSEYTPIQNLAKDYNLDQAIKDNAFVFTNDKIYNENICDLFISKIKNKKEAFLRVIQTTIEGDIIIIDIKYDEKEDKVTIITDNTRDEFSAKENRKITIEEYEHIEEKNEMLETGGVRKLIVYNGELKDDYQVILEYNVFIEYIR